MADVVSVSVSLPRREIIHGMAVETSIVKEPSAGPLMIHATGPENNRTAVHPEAVYAFIAEHYDHWASQLGIDRATWKFGHWGENITFSGLSEHELHIGDVIAVGDDLVMQVTAPRIPCFKLAWRLDQPDTILKSLIASGRIGFYLRVLKPGAVKAGDSVRVTSPHPGNLTVVALLHLIHGVGHEADATPDRLREALRMPGLSQLPADILRNRLNQMTDVAATRQGRWSGWRDFTVTAVTDEAADIRSFRLAPADGGGIAGYRAGQFVGVRVDRGDGAPLSRTWSLSDYAPAGDSYRISVKREPGGRASGFLHDHVRPGSVLALRNPAGSFVLDRSSLFPPVFIAGGIGVTPLLAMLKAHVDRGGEAPPVVWIQCVRDGAHHPFRAEVEALMAARPDFRRLIVYSRPRPGDVAGRDYDKAGRLTLDDVRGLLRDLPVNLGGRVIDFPAESCNFHICGPAEMQHGLVRALRDWGVADGNIHTEAFKAVGGGAGESAAMTGLPEEAEVVFARSGVTALWRREDNQTILELAEAQGLAPDNSCREGVCHTCKCAVREGAVGYAATPAGLEPDRALPCCGRPLSARVVLDI